VDSEVIAYFVGINKPELWQAPTPEVLLFKGLLARLQALNDDLQREKNRLGLTQRLTNNSCLCNDKSLFFMFNNVIPR
jgi:hypothetical protein